MHQLNDIEIGTDLTRIEAWVPAGTNLKGG